MLYHLLEIHKYRIFKYIKRWDDLMNAIQHQYWNNMEIIIIKTYSVFRKKKIKIKETGAILVVDENTISLEQESALSLVCLGGWKCLS